MRLTDILPESVDYTPKGQKHNKETKVLDAMKKWDFGSNSNTIARSDVLAKSSGKDGNVYGRRPVNQRKLKKR